MSDIVTKCCTKCKQDKPLTDFYGKFAKCKTCIRQERKERYVPKPPKHAPVPEGYKWCSHCQQIFAASTQHFYSNKNRPDGLSTLCKECHCEYEQSRHGRPKLVIPETRTCRVCRQEKTATTECFEKMTANVYGLNTVCKECLATARRKPSPYKPSPLGYKRCRQCFEVKPSTPEFFVPSKRAADGLRNQCRECRKAYRRKPLPHQPRKRKHVPTGDKQCIGCKQFFPRTRKYFFFARHAVDHLQSRCKKCFGKQGTERWHALPAEERSRKSRVAVWKRIARKKMIQGSCTSAQIAEQLKRQKYRCYYAACGNAKFPRTKKNGQWKYEYQIEHTFPISRVAGTDIPANDISYLVLACPTCNRSKGSKFPWEWPEGGRLM